MSGVGSSELIILLLIGLIVLGPKRLPQIANQIGTWVGQARRMTRAMRRQLEDELNIDENFKPGAPNIGSPMVTPAPDPADPAYDYDPASEAGDSDEAEAYVPHDDDTFSALHDGEGTDDNEDPGAPPEKPEKKA